MWSESAIKRLAAQPRANRRPGNLHSQSKGPPKLTKITPALFIYLGIQRHSRFNALINVLTSMQAWYLFVCLLGLKGALTAKVILRPRNVPGKCHRKHFVVTWPKLRGCSTLDMHVNVTYSEPILNVSVCLLPPVTYCFRRKITRHTFVCAVLVPFREIMIHAIWNGMLETSPSAEWQVHSGCRLASLVKATASLDKNPVQFALGRGP